MTRDLPRVHPLIADPIESERCPDCGCPGVPLQSLGDTSPWAWACLACDADQIRPSGSETTS